MIEKDRIKCQKLVNNIGNYISHQFIYLLRQKEINKLIALILTIKYIIIFRFNLFFRFNIYRYFTQTTNIRTE